MIANAPCSFEGTLNRFFSARIFNATGIPLLSFAESGSEMAVARCNISSLLNHLPALFILLAVSVVPFVFVAESSAQFGRRPGGPGGPGGGPSGQPADKKIVKDFDKNEDGWLNREERDLAKKSLENSTDQRGGRRGRRRGGRGGRAAVVGKPGPEVSPDDVKSFPEAGLYDTDVLRTVFIEFENEDWEKELAVFKPTNVEIPATLTVDGIKYPNVGLSFRGASSFFMVPEGSKRSLNLSMDFIDDDQRLYGYKSLNFLNCNGDASMMSSYLYTHITSQKIPSPKVNFVKVVINGRSWGIYANAQQFNKDFIKEHFDTKKGTRWKVNGSPRGDAGLRYLGEDVEEYRTRFEIKSKDKEKAWEQLIQLCKVLNETPTEKLVDELEPILDLDGVLWFLAADVALINSDGYWTRASDYSLYLDPKGKFHVIPHDMNESFRAARGGGGPGGPGGPRGRGGGGRFRGGDGPPGGRPDGPPPEGGPPGGGGPGPEGAQRRGGYELDPLVGLDQERFPLRSKLLVNEKLKTQYLKYVRSIAKDHIAWEKMKPRLSSAKSLIEKEVFNDTRKMMSNEAFESAASLEAPVASGSLREFAEKRSDYLLNYPAIKSLSDSDLESESKSGGTK